MRGSAAAAAVAVAVLGLTGAGNASAQSCTEVEEWASACEAQLGVVHCVPGGAVVEARGGGATLRVEIARGRTDAFTTVGELGVSPVGEFPDWSAEPEPVRRLYDSVLACVRDYPDLTVPEGELVPTDEPPSPGGPSVPWFLLVALVAAAVVTRDVLRPVPMPQLRIGVAAVALGAVATYVARWLVFEPGFAHQNGQGPLWVGHALCIPTVYGPGYRETFGWIATSGVEPSGAVFATQAAFASLGPALAWIVVRATGARRELAWAGALAVAVEPALARLAGSESYLGTESTLLLGAAAVLAAGAWNRSARDRAFLFAVLAAGCLVAQAARIHPTAWVPAALVPLVVATGPGQLRGRLLAAAAAFAGVGAVAALGVLALALEVTGGAVGEQWLPGFFSRVPGNRIEIALLAGPLAAVVLVAASKNRRRSLVRALVVLVTIVVAGVTHVIGGVATEVIPAGYPILFAGPLLAGAGTCLAACAPKPKHERWLAVGISFVVLFLAVGRAPPILVRPTDSLEQTHLLEWREHLPEGSTIAFLGVAGRRRLHVPFYGSCGFGPTRAVQLSTEEPLRDLSRMPGPVLWYRSSLCSTVEGRERCAEIERGLSLEEVRAAELPALPSMIGLDYDHHPLRVSLHRVETP